jgi:hypothetical protein
MAQVTRVKTRTQSQSEKDKAEAKVKVQAQAKELLASPYFFRKFLSAMEKAGLVGEQTNALVLLIVTVSRLLLRPLNAFVKGLSSAGKNWLVTRVLLLYPRGRVREISNASEQAWSYANDYFRNRIIYLQERSQAGGAVDPLRLMISERKIIRIVTKWENGQRITKKYVARGPVAAISTTTRHTLTIDDENRHVSLLMDLSPEQTRRIVRSYTKTAAGLSADELRMWHEVHRLIEERSGSEVIFPNWFDEVAESVFTGDVAVRRYYPAFVEACRTVCLIRSFQTDHQPPRDGKIVLEFADFAVTALMFDRVFVQSLHRHEGSTLEVRQAVKVISSRKGHAGAADLEDYLGISLDSAYERLRLASSAGVIRRANSPEEDNRKFYVPAPRPRFIPDPEELFARLKAGPDSVRFVHPRTGEWITYSREKKRKSD